MKKANRSRAPKAAASPSPAAPVGLRLWHVLAGVAIAAAAVFQAYEPALDGPFLFDDIYLPVHQGFHEGPSWNWLFIVRPMLIFNYWLNYQIGGGEPDSYHVISVLLHLANALLVFLILRRLLEKAGEIGWRREILAAFAGGLFLLHPVQTESVAYIASRSENLSVLFFYGAFAAFLYLRPPISFPGAAAVLILFGMAVFTKEHTAVLPALLLLTDYFWNPGFSFEGIRRNWRLYIPTAVAGAIGAALVWRLLASADTAGFAVKGVPWYSYFFTQGRAIWVYVRMFLLPYGLNVDPDFPLSESILDHGAIFGLVALAAAVLAAWWYRRRFPGASFGILVFLLLLAPTSSVVPIKDPIAERRVYLASLGLLLVACEPLRRWKTSPVVLGGALSAVLVVYGVVTYQRNHVWSSAVALWEDSAAKSPRKVRPHFQLGFAYYEQGRCQEAAQAFQKAAELAPPDYTLLVDWALALDCLQKPGEAVAKLKEAISLENSAHAWSLIGMVRGKQGQRQEALQALETAARINPDFAMTYVYRGNVYVNAGELEKAVADFRTALRLQPENQAARQGLEVAERGLRQSP